MDLEMSARERWHGGRWGWWWVKEKGKEVGKEFGKEIRMEDGKELGKEMRMEAGMEVREGGREGGGEGVGEGDEDGGGYGDKDVGQVESTDHKELRPIPPALPTDTKQTEVMGFKIPNIFTFMKI